MEFSLCFKTYLRKPLTLLHPPNLHCAFVVGTGGTLLDVITSPGFSWRGGTDAGATGHDFMLHARSAGGLTAMSQSSASFIVLRAPPSRSTHATCRVSLPGPQVVEHWNTIRSVGKNKMYASPSTATQQLLKMHLNKHEIKL